MFITEYNEINSTKNPLKSIQQRLRIHVIVQKYFKAVSKILEEKLSLANVLILRDTILLVHVIIMQSVIILPTKNKLHQYALLTKFEVLNNFWMLRRPVLRYDCSANTWWEKKDGNTQGEKVWVDHSNLGPLFESQVTPVRSFSN